MIMYDELFEAWKREKMSGEIQPLPRDFYARLAEYIKRIDEEQRMLDEITVKGALMRRERDYVRRMVEELIRIRGEKMIDLIREGKMPPAASLTEEEENWLKEASPHLESFRRFAENLLRGKLMIVKSKTGNELMVVRILRELPEIVGVDMKTYGPFKPEDIASLPAENAKALIRQGAAVEVEQSQ